MLAGQSSLEYITSLVATQLFLGHLKRYNFMLECVNAVWQCWTSKCRLGVGEGTEPQPSASALHPGHCVESSMGDVSITDNVYYLVQVKNV